MTDTAYIKALDAAVDEFRELTKELVIKERRFVQVRCAILGLANSINVSAPSDVLAGGDKRASAMRRAVLRSASALAAIAAPDHAGLREALKEIVKGEGAYSRDPLTHASNVIDNMKAIAQAALGSPVPTQEKK